MKTIYLPEAEAEMHEAAQYYDSESKGLGDRFYDVMASAVEDVERLPRLAPVIRAGVRRRLMSVFPYAIIYVIHHDEIVVVAVAHLHREPLYWLPRESKLSRQAFKHSTNTSPPV